MNVYRIATVNGLRFVRAMSSAHARVRLFKSQGLRAHAVDLFGNNAPQAYAAVGYDSAVNTRDIAALVQRRKGGDTDYAQESQVSARDLRMVQRGGDYSTFYNRKHENEVRATNRAAENEAKINALLGIA